MSNSVTPRTSLVIGASRGLGLSLTKELASRGSHVFATVRSAPKDDHFPTKNVTVLAGIDVSKEDAGTKIVEGLKSTQVDLVVIVAGLLKEESLDKLSWEDEIAMYTICSIAPPFLVSALLKGDSFAPSAKLVLLTSEGGSITLRTESEGGGMFGHHGSKAAANMIGKLLSFDLKAKVTVAMIHPGFLKTEMTGGMKEHYEKGGAVTPDEAAKPFVDFVEKLDPSKTGQFWAPLGPKGIGNAEEVLGKGLPTPLQVPW